ARHRPLGRELHRNARARRSGRLSVFRPRAVERRRRIVASPPGSDGGSMAALAFLRRAVPLGVARNKRIERGSIMLLHYDEFGSPIGSILFASDGEAVCAIDFSGYESRMEMLLARRYDTVEFRRESDPLGLKLLLDDYFAGNLHAFDAVSVRTGGSAFQESVWKALR